MQTTTITSTPREIRGAVATLGRLLEEQTRYLRQVTELVRERVLAHRRGDPSTVLACLEVEKEALTAYVLAERERIAALTRIGLALEHRRPSRLRLAELIFYVDPDTRDDLLEIREEIRDLADELERLRAQARCLRHHVVGPVTLFVTPDAEPVVDPADLLGQARASLESGEGPSDGLEAREPVWEPEEYFLPEE